jgi:hypothetical protein
MRGYRFRIWKACKPRGEEGIKTYGGEKYGKAPQHADPTRQHPPRDHDPYPHERNNVKDERDVELEVELLCEGGLNRGWEGEG